MKNLIYLAVLLLSFGCNPTKEDKSLKEGDTNNFDRTQNQFTKVPLLDTIIRSDDPHEFRPWQIKSFVDESGNLSDEKYVKYYTTIFINTPDSSFQYVYVKVIVTKNTAGIFIHDNGSKHPAKKLTGTVTMTMALSSHEKSVIEIDTEWDINGGFRIVNNVNPEKSYFTDFLNCLKNSPSGFVVSFEDEYLTEYSFFIPTEGFSEEFTLL